MSSDQDLQQNINIQPVDVNVTGNMTQIELDENLVDSIQALENQVNLLTQKCEILWQVIQHKIANSDHKVKEKIRKLNLKHNILNN